MKKHFFIQSVLIIIVALTFTGCPMGGVLGGIGEDGSARDAGAIKPVPLSPLGITNELHPVFSWGATSGVTRYWLLVMDGPTADSSNWLIDDGAITTTSYSSNNVNFEVGKTYYWKVKGVTTGTSGAWSSVVSFTIQNPNSGTYAGRWDLNADGVLESVFQHPDRIDVSLGTSGYKQYYIGTGFWSIVSNNVVDTDGTAGPELIIQTATEIKVICHKKQTMRTYTIGSAFWSFYVTADLDGIAGAEIIVQRQTSILVICDRTGVMKTYSIGPNGEYWSLRGIGETNGVAGNEIIVAKQQSVVIVNHRNGTIKAYQISSGFWSFISYNWWLNDTDGTVGNEVILQTATTIVILCDYSKTLRTYTLGSGFWTVESVYNRDGYAGVEILIRMADNTLKVINDRLRKIQNG